MGAVTLPTTGTVYVDAQIVIYTVEQHPKWAAPLVPFWAAVTSGGVQVLTSELTILEALVVPFRSGDQQIIGAYDRFFRRPELAWIPVSRAVLRAAAELRSVVPRRMFCESGS